MAEEKVNRKLAEEIMQDLLNFFKKVREKSEAMNEFYNEFLKKQGSEEQKS